MSLNLPSGTLHHKRSASPTARQRSLFQTGNLSLSAGDGGSTTGTYNVSANTTLTLGGNFTFTGPATITGAGSAVITGNTTTATGVTIASLTIDKSLQIKSNGTSTGTTKVPNLTIPGGTAPSGTFDLTNNRAIVEPPVASKATVLATLEAQADYGKSHPTGILSTQLAPSTNVAVFDNGALAVPFTTFGGLPADSGSILIGPELLGDANIDGHVDLTDLSTLLNNFGQSTPNWTSGNFDNAPTIDLTDLSDVLNNFGLTNPNASFSQLPITDYQLPTPTPEPTSLALLTLAASPLLTRRRRH